MKITIEAETDIEYALMCELKYLDKSEKKSLLRLAKALRERSHYIPQAHRARKENRNAKNRRFAGRAYSR